jgi:drug/metabolite transporter (DMT)-like permease
VSTVATYAYVNPVIAVVLGVLLADEDFGVAQLVGGLIVVCAVVLVVRAETRASRKTVVPEGTRR